MFYFDLFSLDHITRMVERKLEILNYRSVHIPLDLYVFLIDSKENRKGIRDCLQSFPNSFQGLCDNMVLALEFSIY